MRDTADWAIDILGAAISQAIRDIRAVHHRRDRYERELAKAQMIIKSTKRIKDAPTKVKNRYEVLRTDLLNYKTAMDWIFEPTRLEAQLDRYGLTNINMDSIRRAAVDEERVGRYTLRRAQ